MNPQGDEFSRRPYTSRDPMDTQLAGLAPVAHGDFMALQMLPTTNTTTDRPGNRPFRMYPSHAELAYCDVGFNAYGRYNDGPGQYSHY